MHVVFKLPLKVAMGESVSVIGSHEKIGSWNNNKAVKLTWSEGNVWQVGLDLPAE